MLGQLLINKVLIGALLAWGLAQLLKVPIGYIVTHRIDLRLMAEPGGMPSSHSALVTTASLTIGLYEGFETALFALSVVVAMVVIYDAIGIRRQAGKHAELINILIRDLAAGHPFREAQLQEVLGHTPTQAFFGVVLGLLVAGLEFFFWH